MKADALTLNDDLLFMFELIRQRQTGPARVRLNKYLKLHPDDGKAAFLFGLTYHREKKYGQAVPHFAKALELSPDYHMTHYFNAWAKYYLGDLEASREAFETFLRYEADEPDALFGLGLIDLDEDNLDSAEKNLLRSIELENASSKPDPANLSKAHARLGETYDRKGDLARARAELELAASLYPDHYEALYKLYRVLVRLGEEEEAKRVHQAYLAARERVRPGTSFPE